MKNKKIILFISIMVLMLVSISVKAEMYRPDEIENGTYIIGFNMFTHKDDDYADNNKYKGVLTTQHIMYGAQSIMSNDLNNMIIYYKNPRGQWKNAINNSDVTVPEDGFEILYVDMEAINFAPEITQGDADYGNPGIIILNFGDAGTLDEVSISRIEVYSRDDADGEYVLVAKTESNNPLEEFYSEDFVRQLDIGINEHKYFAIRVVTTEGKYSYYSNEVDADTTIGKPLGLVHNRVTDEATQSSYPDFTSCTATTCDAVVSLEHINHMEQGDYDIYPEGAVDGYDVFEVGNDDDPVATSTDINGVTYVRGTKGETKYYYARAFKIDYDGSNVYGPASDEIIIEFKRHIGQPVIDVKEGTTPYEYSVGINRQGTCLSNCDDADSTNDVMSVTHFNIYVKTSEGSYRGVQMAVPANEYYTYYATPGVPEDLIIEVYEDLGDNGYNYGEMSEIYSINPVAIPLPNITYQGDPECEGDQCRINLTISNTDAYTTYGINISSWGLYVVGGDESIPVALTSPESLNVVKTPFITKGDSKYYYARVSITVGENTYYSEPLTTGLLVRFDDEGNLDIQ